MRLKLSGSVTLQAWPPQSIVASVALGDARRRAAREQVDGTSMSSVGGEHQRRRRRSRRADRVDIEGARARRCASRSSRRPGNARADAPSSASSCVVMLGDPVARDRGRAAARADRRAAPLSRSSASRASKQRSEMRIELRPAVDDDQPVEPLRRLERERQPDRRRRPHGRRDAARSMPSASISASTSSRHVARR